MQKQRSLLIFENSIRSDETRKKYLYYLEQFKNFYKLRDYDSIISISTEQLQIMVEDYVMDLKNRISPNTLPTPMYAIQSFFEANDIELKWKKIKRLYPARVKKSGGKAWTTKDIQKMLSRTTEIRTKVLIHFLAASGVRIGALNGLQVRHLTRISDNCYSVLIYEDSTEEYTTFLTPEASAILDEYLEKRKNDGEYVNQNSPLVRNKYRLGIQKVKPASDNSLKQIIHHLLHKSGLRSNKKGNRYEQQADHGFRKRWNTIVKTTDGMKIILAEKMFAHSTPTIPLDETYLDPTIDKLFTEYKKAIPELTIDDAQRERAEKDKLLLEKSQLEVDKQLMRDMQKDLQEIKLKQQRHDIANEEKEKDLKKKIKDLEQKLENSDRNS